MKTLTVKEVSELLGQKPWAVYRLIALGHLPARRLSPNKVVIIKDELDEYLKNLPSAAKPKQGG